MRDRFSISDVGLKLIKTYEGFRPVDMELVSGQRVVGYGHRVSDGASSNLTKAEAEALLLSDLAPYEAMVNDHVFAPISQSQFDALCSLAFNIGPKKFLQSDTLRALNNGRILDAAYGFDVWRRAKINGESYVVDALVRRRTAEKVLFLRPHHYGALAPRVELDAIMDEKLVGMSTQAPDPILEQSGIVGQINYDENVSFDFPEQEDLETDVSAGYMDRRDPNNANALKPTPMRRKDDHPGGVLTLSEIFDDEADFANDFDDHIHESVALDMNESGFENCALIEDIKGFVLDIENKNDIHPPDSDDLVQDVAEELTADADFDDMIIVEGTQLETIPAHAVDDTADYAFDPERDILPQSLTAELDAPREDTSPIAEAAAEVSDRLDALMADEGDVSAALEERKVLPFTPREDVIDSLEDSSENLDAQTAETSAKPAPAKEAPRKSKQRYKSNGGHDHPYNDLLADDMTDGDEFDDEYNSASRYIEHSAAAPQGQGGSLALSLMTIIGMSILGGSLGAIASGFDSRYGSTGNLLSSIGVVLGIMITLGSVYYILKNSRRLA